MVYLDSCVLIASLTNPDQTIRRLLDLVQNGDIEGLISTVSYVEVLGDHARLNGPDGAQEQRALALLDHPRLTVVETSRAVALRARRYAIQFRLKPMDAIHLAAAVEGGADALLTTDEKFAKNVKDGAGIWIGKPYEPGDPTLFPAP